MAATVLAAVVAAILAVNISIMLQTMSLIPSTLPAVDVVQRPLGICPTAVINPECPAISIVAQVASRPLCISIPHDLMQHHSCEELVAATLVLLGGKCHRILACPKLRPNSHGIVVQVGVEKVSWTWPTLSGEDVGLSAAGYWLPIQGAA